MVGRVANVRRPAFTVIASLLLSSVPLALLAIIDEPVIACAVLVAVGVGVVVFEVLSITLVQRLSRIDLLGRVFGIENMAVNAGKLAGATLAPLLVTVLSLSSALVAAALIVGLSAIDAGAMVLRQGDAPDNLYVIRSGAFEVIKDGVHVATIGTDDWFGEIGLLRQTPRTAAVVATERAEVWEIPGGDFLATVNESALPPTALLDAMTARLAELAEIDAASEVNWRSDGGDPDGA
jgi:CRP-like cAMP-binding protein